MDATKFVNISVNEQGVEPYIHKGFHGWDLMVVMGFSGSLAVF